MPIQINNKMVPTIIANKAIAMLMLNKMKNKDKLEPRTPKNVKTIPKDSTVLFNEAHASAKKRAPNRNSRKVITKGKDIKSSILILDR